MSDERVRELERRWRESGAWSDRLTWLHAERRAGRLAEDEAGLLEALDAGLPLERLALLAYLGVPAAGRVLGDEAVALATHLGDLGGMRVVLGDEVEDADVRAWAVGLARFAGAGRALELLTEVAAAQAGVYLDAHEVRYLREVCQDAAAELTRRKGHERTSATLRWWEVVRDGFGLQLPPILAAGAAALLGELGAAS